MGKTLTKTALIPIVVCVSVLGANEHGLLWNALNHLSVLNTGQRYNGSTQDRL